MWICVGPEQVPNRDGVFTFELTAGADPVVGARIRVYDNAEPDCTVLDDCDFLYEYLVDYIPAGGTMTLGGPSGAVETVCDGDPVPQDASTGVHGNYGGPIPEPVAQCDRRYLVEVHQLDKYPRDGGDDYTIGHTEGSMHVSLLVTSREG
jgi:hypothetical protein